jgi:hypothetical protein
MYTEFPINQMGNSAWWSKKCDGGWDRESRIEIWNQRLKRKLCESHYNQHCAHKIKLSDIMNQWHLTTTRNWTVSQHAIEQSAKCGNTNLLWCLWIDSWTTRKIGNPYGFDGHKLFCPTDDLLEFEISKFWVCRGVRGILQWVSSMLSASRLARKIPHICTATCSACWSP